MKFTAPASLVERISLRYHNWNRDSSDCRRCRARGSVRCSADFFAVDHGKLRRIGGGDFRIGRAQIVIGDGDERKIRVFGSGDHLGQGCRFHRTHRCAHESRQRVPRAQACRRGWVDGQAVHPTRRATRILRMAVPGSVQCDGAFFQGQRDAPRRSRVRAPKFRVAENTPGALSSIASECDCRFRWCQGEMGFLILCGKERHALSVKVRGA